MKIVILLLFILGGSCGVCLTEYSNKKNTTEDWQIINEPSLRHALHHKPIFFFDQKTGIALTGLSIKKTTDSGKSWKTVFDDEKVGIYSGDFTNAKSGWVAGTKEKIPIILNSQDKGNTWKSIKYYEDSLKQLSKNFSYFRDFCFDVKNNIWAVGDGGLVQMIIENNKLKLKRMLISDIPLSSVACSSSSEIWAVGNNNTIYQFKGKWNKIHLKKNNFFYKVKADKDDIWLIGKNSLNKGVLLYLKKEDFAWINKMPTSARIIYDMEFLDGKCWVIGSEGRIFYSENRGKTWTKIKSPTKKNLFSIFVLDSKNAWIGGDNGIILKK